MNFIIKTNKFFIRAGIKFGIPVGSVYGAHYYGFFGTSDQAQKAVEKLQSDIKQAKQYTLQYIPKEVLDKLGELPRVNFNEMVPLDLSSAKLPQLPDNTRSLWNRGVLFTFSAIANSPNSIPNAIENLIKSEKKLENVPVLVSGNAINTTPIEQPAKIQEDEQCTKPSEPIGELY